MSSRKRLCCLAAIILGSSGIGSVIAREAIRYHDWALAVTFLLVIAETLCVSALIRSLVPSLAAADKARTAYRLKAAWRALRGRPVAYKISAEGGGITVSNSTHAIIANCVCTGLPGAGVLITQEEKSC